MNETESTITGIERPRGLLPREALKLIACLTMLIYHTAAVFLPWEQALPLRIVGRLAFPIFCFLLAEGAHYTHNPLKYASRLAIGMVLAEVPFDLLFYGKLTWEHSSVMVTLLLGLIAILAVQKLPGVWLQLPVMALCVIGAEHLNTDYSGLGVLLMLGMYLARGAKHPGIARVVIMTAIFWAFNSYKVPIVGDFKIPLQMFAVLAFIPIELYSGKKLTSNKVAQWGFYLFYPVHIAVLLLIKKLT